MNCRVIKSYSKMPEGPEVRITAEGLRGVLGDNFITSITINRKSRYYNKTISNFDSIMYPLFVENVYSKGKKIIFVCTEPDNTKIVLINALGMEGSWKPYDGKHAGIEMECSSGETLYFHDTRHFGTFHVCRDNSEYNFVMKDVGPDLFLYDGPELFLRDW